MGSPSRAGKAVSIAIGAVTGVAVIALAGSVFVMARVARTVVTPSKARKQDQLVMAFDADRGEVTLAATPDTRVPGRFGLWLAGDSGYARVGEIVREGQGTVTRRVDEVVFGELRRGPARWSGWYYLKPEELGFPVRAVELDSTLGQAPAWVIPAAGGASDATGSPWAILVHGRGAEREETLRAVPVFRECGYTCLIVSYRNDGSAPESADRRYGLGDTEWLDVDAGISFALAEGASSIVLMGWSMGGAIVLQTATRSASHEKITGLILESPVVDWIDTLEYQARILGIPEPIARGARRMIEEPWGTRITGLDQAIDLDGLDFVTRALDLSIPTLIMHSDDDGYVPSTASRALAEARPDIVTLVPFSVAKHTRLWNYDPDRWNDAIRSWLTRV